MTRIRLAYLLSGLRRGGAERQMLALAERLPKDRYDVTFLALIGESEYDRRAIEAGASVRLLGDAPSPQSSRYGAFAQRAAKVVRYAAVARAERYDIVDAWLYPADVVAALTRRITGAKVVISGRRNIDPHDLFGPLDPMLDRLVNRVSDAVVANSAASAAHAVLAQHVDPAKVRVIRNGVAPAPRPTESEVSALRASFGLSDDHLIVGCVGTLSAVKNQADVVTAVGSLMATVPNLRLVLVGDGPTRGLLEDQVRGLELASVVRFHGSVAEPTPLYHAFDVVVQASLREGLPNVLLEAGAAGIPIVASDVGGSSEIVVHGQTGLLAPVGDQEALAAAMLALLTSSSLRAEYSQAVRKHVNARFGMERYVSEFESLYEELLEKASR